jgi:hypothetical protein
VDYRGRKTFDQKNWTIDVLCGPLTSVLQNVFGTNNPISFLSLVWRGAESMVLNVLDLNAITGYGTSSVLLTLS